MMSEAVQQLNHVYFMLVKTTTIWLQIPTTGRFKFLETTISPILKQYPSVKMRFFDSEAFSGRYSDVIMWETAEVQEYQFLVDKLRETLFWDTYFEVIEIVPSIENAYAIHHGVAPISGN